MRFKLPILLYLAIGLCFSVNLVKAQGSDAQYFAPSVYPKSPNVASFAKYGDYQVNLFTGLPDISIPLYTVEAGGLKVPITLSYHASGIKLTDVASWVGLGWSIPGGGAISRRILGRADDDTYGYLNGGFRGTGPFNTGVTMDMQYLDDVSRGKLDGRPDIFSYDFSGHSGKFFLDGTNNYTPVLLPYAAVKITYPDHSLGYFNVTDEQGNNYKFGFPAIETTYTGGAGNVATPATTSWMMDYMISQNRRDTISFTYGDDYLIYPSGNSQMEALTDQINNAGGDPPNPYTVSDNPGTTTSSSTGVAEKPLNQINFKNGYVLFEKDDTLRKDINIGGAANNVYGLKDIKVYAYNYSTKVMEVEKTIKFYKSYFGTAAKYNFRLRLDSIQILDAAGAVIQHYR
ncbi:MAG: hypothetical protein JWP37_3481, partial [Mucilaginibacter sp.]|nr:hypothetical protein [Mucilaginibacter sp.]